MSEINYRNIINMCTKIANPRGLIIIFYELEPKRRKAPSKYVYISVNDTTMLDRLQGLTCKKAYLTRDGEHYIKLPVQQSEDTFRIMNIDRMRTRGK